MAILPRFSEPGTYKRYLGANILNDQDPTVKIRYILLQERVYPLKYPFQFTSTQAAPIAAGAKTDPFTFRDLDPKPGHVYETFLGLTPGARYQLSHPFDIRQLKWDEKIQDITEDYTANLEYDESPIDAPTFRIWIPQGKRYPSIVAQNITDSLYQGGSSISPEVLWIAAKWRVVEANERNTPPALWAQLQTDTRMSEPITFGGEFPTG